VGPLFRVALCQAVDQGTPPLLFPIGPSSSCAASASPLPATSCPCPVPPPHPRAPPGCPGALQPDHRRHPLLPRPNAGEHHPPLLHNCGQGLRRASPRPKPQTGIHTLSASPPTRCPTIPHRPSSGIQPTAAALAPGAMAERFPCPRHGQPTQLAFGPSQLRPTVNSVISLFQFSLI
jgi:hypothetical protein